MNEMDITDLDIFYEGTPMESALMELQYHLPDANAVILEELHRLHKKIEATEELDAILVQFAFALNQAHGQLMEEVLGRSGLKLEIEKLDWGEYTLQANAIRAAESYLGQKLAKTNAWTLYPDNQKLDPPEPDDPVDLLREVQGLFRELLVGGSIENRSEEILERIDLTLNTLEDPHDSE